MTVGNKLWWASLNPASPRYAKWLAILGSDDVPLRGPAEISAVLGDDGEHRVYLLDLDQLNDQQVGTLVEILVAKFQTTAAEVCAEIEANNRTFPMRAEDVIVAFSMRAFL